MRRFLTYVLLLSISSMHAAKADSNGNFPGKGKHEDWHKAAALGKQATKLCENGQLQEAETLLRQAVEIYPHDASIYYNLGNCLDGQRKYADAIQDYKRAIAIEPRYLKAHYNLGLAYDHMKNYSQAEVSYRKVLQLNPNDGGALFNLGAVLLDEQRFKEARTMFNRAAKCPNVNSQEVRDALREVDQKETLSKKAGIR